MSRKTTSGKPKRAAWSGGRPPETPKHRWQRASGGASDLWQRVPRPRRWMFVVIAALGLVAFLVYLVVMRPRPTPFVVVTVTDYDFPLPLNDWAREDGEAFLQLPNLRTLDVSPRWNERKRKTANDIIPDGLSLGRGAPLIVYLSMHGVVTKDGEPCLLPTTASIDDAKSLIPLADVMDEMERFAPQRNKLLILDCNRIRVNWNLGILDNTFAERAAALVADRAKEEPDGSFAVLMSAGPGQSNWASPQLQGSAFGRFLQLGLAGDADSGHGFAWSKDVTLWELRDYLQRELAAWSEANRGEFQEPLLLPDNVHDFHLVYCPAGSGTVDSLKSRLSHSEESKPAVSMGDLASLWDQFDKLRADYELLRWNPVACRDMEHQLLRVEQLAHGGRAYENKAQELLKDLQDELEAWQKRASAAGNSLITRLSDTLQSEWLEARRPAHSLPAGEYLGELNADQAASADDALSAMIHPSTTDIDELLEKNHREAMEALSEAQLLISARQQNVVALWPSGYDALRNLRELRTVSEQAALPRNAAGKPGDERAHYYARPLAGDADRLRRTAEDVLFVGARNARESQFKTLAEKPNDFYQRAQHVFRQATEAFDARDRALATTPYLAAWLCAPLTSDLENRDEHITRDLVPLIKNTRQLADNLDEHICDPAAPSESSQPPFVELKDRVTSQFDTLKGLFDAEVEELSKEGIDDDPRRLAAIDAILTVPLIPGGKRQALLERRAEISAQLHDGYFKTLSHGEHETKAAEAASHDSESKHASHASHASESSRQLRLAYADRMARWQDHPLLAILDLSVPVADDGQREKAAAIVRDALAASQQRNSGVIVAGDESKDIIARNRQPLCLSERRLRAAAAISHHDNPAEAEAPVDDLRRYDIQQLLIWLGRRVMDDFWVASDDGGRGAPFFVEAASDYFDPAKRIGDELRIRSQLKDCTDVLSKRWDASGKNKNLARFHVTASSKNLLMESDTNADVQIEVAPAPAVKNFPQGIAAVFLRNHSERLPDVEIRGTASHSKPYVVVDSPASVAQQFTARVRDVSPDSATLESATFFRGREDRSDLFDLAKFGGRVVLYQPHRYTMPSITLFGDAKQQWSVMLVFDCSWSMNELAQDQSEVKADANRKPRLEVAKKVLSQLLDQIAERNEDENNTENIHVGLRLFGHRYAMPEEGGKKFRPQQEYLEAAAATEWVPLDSRQLPPSRDIQLIYPMQRLTDDDAKNIDNLLKKVKPWGITPLFRAIVESLSDFDRMDPDRRKAIILITDGDNNEERLERSPVSKEQVLAACKQHPNIPLYIVGFDLATSDKAYEEIAEASGGKYYSVNSGSQLSDVLQARLERDKYEVRQLAPQPDSGIKAPLNETIERELPDRRPAEFDVTFRDVVKKVRLEGGEGIVLRVKDQDIVADPYPPSGFKAKALIDSISGKPTDLEFKITPPEKRGRNVEFLFALQRKPDHDHFTPRPKEIWIEAAPILGDGSEDQPYLFYDCNFEPHMPVPVLKLTATDWPDSARKAYVRFWCKYEDRPTTQKKVVQLRDAFDSATGKFRELPVAEGVTLTIELDQSSSNVAITVREQHDKRLPAFEPFRLRFESEAIQPTTVKRQFDTKNRLVVHTFHFEKDAGDLRTLRSARLDIASSQEVKKGALCLPADSPLQLEIGGDTALFAPSATQSGR